MISFKSGDILAENTEALVNTVNCVGVMGRGVALQFKRAFPDNFKAYEAACKKGEVAPGRMFVFDRGAFINPRYIINFPTKRHWKNNSVMEDIDAGLLALREEIIQRNIRTIALPPLGCGLGGLFWPDVRERIIKTLILLPNVNAVVFMPNWTPQYSNMRRNCNNKHMTLGRAILVSLIDKYLSGFMDVSVSLLIIHKLMYFMQERGESLKLDYVKGYYGPYAKNMRHVLEYMDGYLLNGYDGTDDPCKQIELTHNAGFLAKSFLTERLDTISRIRDVSELMEGFESSLGLELLATVHWVVTHEGACSFESIVSKIQTWNERKKRFFSARRINIAFEALCDKGWI